MSILKIDAGQENFPTLAAVNDAEADALQELHEMCLSDRVSPGASRYYALPLEGRNTGLATILIFTVFLPFYRPA